MWWLILGYVVISLVTIRVIAELPGWPDWSDERTPASIMGGIFWPMAIVVGVVAGLYVLVFKPLATPRRIHRRRRQDRVRILRTRTREMEREIEAAARAYGLAYPKPEQDAITPDTVRRY